MNILLGILTGPITVGPKTAAPAATGGGTDRYLSEDYMFCQLWRKLGGQIWLCPWMRTDHIGTYHFKGDMPAVANFVGEM